MENENKEQTQAPRKDTLSNGLEGIPVMEIQTMDIQTMELPVMDLNF